MNIKTAPEETTAAPVPPPSSLAVINIMPRRLPPSRGKRGDLTAQLSGSAPQRAEPATLTPEIAAPTMPETAATPSELPSEVAAATAAPLPVEAPDAAAVSDTEEAVFTAAVEAPFAATLVPLVPSSAPEVEVAAEAASVPSEAPLSAAPEPGEPPAPDGAAQDVPADTVPVEAEPAPEPLDAQAGDAALSAVADAPIVAAPSPEPVDAGATEAVASTPAAPSIPAELPVTVAAPEPVEAPAPDAAPSTTPNLVVSVETPAPAASAEPDGGQATADDRMPPPVTPVAAPPVAAPVAEPTFGMALPLRAWARPRFPFQAPPAPEVKPRGTDIVAYWHGLRRGGSVPDLIQIDQTIVAETWRNSLLLALGPNQSGASEPGALRIKRLGQITDDVEYTPMVIDSILSLGQRAVTYKTPLDEILTFPLSGGMVRCRLVLLPLTGSSGRIDHVLCQLSRAATSSRLERRG